MEKKFRDALIRVLEDGSFRNVLALANTADVDQGGLSKFLKGLGYGGKMSNSASVKKDLNLQTVSKLIDCMGGVLVFPWEGVGASLQAELDAEKDKTKKLEGQIEELKINLKKLEVDLVASERVVNKLSEILKDQQHGTRTESAEFKSCG